MKTKIFAVLGLLLTAFYSAIIFADNAPQPLDKIAAVVNSEVITESQVQQLINVAKRQAQATNQTLPDDSQLRQQAIDQLIDQKMIMILGKRNNVTVTPAQVDQAISDIAAHNNMSVDQMKIELMKQGMDYTQYRNQIHDQMLVQQVEIRALGPKLAVSDAEVRKFMQSNPTSGNGSAFHVEDILVVPASTSEHDGAEALQKANDTVALLQKNPNISRDDLIKTGVQVNDLDWRALKDLPDLFSSKVATMKTSDVVGPISAPNGVHVIKLLGVRGAAQPKLTFIQARNMMMQQKLQEQMKPWLAKLRATAYIKIM